ncbi:hypothetical protein N1851_022931 [Merluccius polli]|uniref:Integrase core domain-containing protein n=1 Tax=Merluccius polli TaxID=89951 RepID=A0AA47MHH4_MERPO|nr:hypothetical protein N1851_022931 [Merluccius polli]
MIRPNHFAIISDLDLDDLVRDVVAGNDQIGPESVRTSLRTRGFCVQRRRVRESMMRTNPGAAAVRALLRRPERRVYQGPNSLWHIDGNHKLIRWRIVIHGGIDGFSRLIVFLRASNNNRSSTVIRTDRGGENADICMFMNVFRGTRRGSAIQGRSVHNQRIERLWGDMWRGISNVYHRLFYFLESEGRLGRLHQSMEPPWIEDRKAQEPNATLCERMSPPAGTTVHGYAASLQHRMLVCHLQMLILYTHHLLLLGHNQLLLLGHKHLLLLLLGRVAVPHDEYTIDDAVMGQIRAQFDPLSGPRGEHGITLIRGLLSFMDSVPENRPTG